MDSSKEMIDEFRGLKDEVRRNTEETAGVREASEKLYNAYEPPKGTVSIDNFNEIEFPEQVITGVGAVSKDDFDVLQDSIGRRFDEKVQELHSSLNDIKEEIQDKIADGIIGSNDDLQRSIDDLSYKVDIYRERAEQTRIRQDRQDPVPWTDVKDVGF